MNVLLLSRNQPMGHYRNNDVIVPLKCLGGFTSYATNGTLQRSWRHYPCYLCSPITTQQQLTATGSGSSFFLSERDAHHFLEINKIIFTVQWLLSERGHDHVARPELLCWSSKRQQKILKLSEKTAVILYDNRSTMFPMVFFIMELIFAVPLATGRGGVTLVLLKVQQTGTLILQLNVVLASLASRITGVVHMADIVYCFVSDF